MESGASEVAPEKGSTGLAEHDDETEHRVQVLKWDRNLWAADGEDSKYQ